MNLNKFLKRSQLFIYNHTVGKKKSASKNVLKSYINAIYSIEEKYKRRSLFLKKAIRSILEMKSFYQSNREKESFDKGGVQKCSLLLKTGNRF